MCGAVSIQYDPVFRKELVKFFSEEEIQNFEQNGEIVFAYWDKRPMLPIRKGKEICFMDWGNRDEKLCLPKTGWARFATGNTKHFEFIPGLDLVAFRPS